jgi:hypothetical protein
MKASRCQQKMSITGLLLKDSHCELQEPNLILPKINESRLLLGMNSYTSIFSSPWTQQPKSLTKFRCCSFDRTVTSFLNSSNPWLELFDSLLIAISFPSGSFPWNCYELGWSSGVVNTSPSSNSELSNIPRIEMPQPCKRDQIHQPQACRWNYLSLKELSRTQLKVSSKIPLSTNHFQICFHLHMV